ncbi:hypothetical protein J3B02_004088, partial [Coemansia erecta]
MSDEKRVKYTVHSNGDIPALKGDIETGYSYEQPQPQHQRGQRTGHRGRFLKKLVIFLSAFVAFQLVLHMVPVHHHGRHLWHKVLGGHGGAHGHG